MFKPQYLIIASLLFARCGSSTEKSVTTVDSSTIKSQTKVVTEKQQPLPKSLKERILGVWTDGSDVNASFMIEKDSILYIDDPEKHSYRVVGNHINIKLDGGDDVYKIYFKKDTMLMSSSDDEVRKYWRFKD